MLNENPEVVVNPLVTSKSKTVLNNKRRVTVLIKIIIMLREILKNYTSINVLN